MPRYSAPFINISSPVFDSGDAGAGVAAVAGVTGLASSGLLALPMGMLPIFTVFGGV